MCIIGKRFVVTMAALCALVVPLSACRQNGGAGGLSPLLEKQPSNAEQTLSQFVRIEYEVDAITATTDDMAQAVSIIRTRLANMGFNDAEVVYNERRIAVCTPPIADVVQVMAEIAQTAHLTFKDTDGTILLDGKEIVTAKGTTHKGTNGATEYAVSVKLSELGTKQFAEATERNIGNPIYIRLDGVVISAPVVNTVITDGNALITGGFTETGAEQFAALLRAGKLPFGLDVISVDSWQR